MRRAERIWFDPVLQSRAFDVIDAGFEDFLGFAPGAGVDVDFDGVAAESFDDGRFFDLLDEQDAVSSFLENPRGQIQADAAFPAAVVKTRALSYAVNDQRGDKECV